MTNSPQNRSTNAFFLQAAISFIVSFAGVGLGIAFLPVDIWVRGFLGIGSLYVVTSTFTLAKCIRDRQEAAILERVTGNPQYYAG
ncbi:YiaA/YiaB family inner membrane protein [Actinocorallia longicatena]|uniref:YiaAB two helix domain-containing protein n=1 Tax=Actinocorallia longicatena TaxID=111803 RepID=A0ABP6QFU7_9ACTN